MQKKTAGIYDRWLSTLGGGEQVAFAYAQTLKELGYSVTLLTHKKVDVQEAETKMGISLSEIKIEYLMEASSETLSGVSEKFDVFINTSHLDYFANRSNFGILSVFFPGILKLSVYEYLKRALFVPSFRRLFIYPSRYEGFAYDQHIKGKIYKWLSKESSIVFKESVQEFKISLYFETFSLSVIDEIEFHFDDKVVPTVTRSMNKNSNVISYTFTCPDTIRKCTIKLPNNDYSARVALTSLTIPNVRYVLYNMFKKAFPIWEMRLHGGPGITRTSDLESYHKIVTISEFCKKWIKNYWALDSDILYPPVNTENFYSAKRKKNYILHVGRFFITGHSKKQLELVKLYKHMVNKYNLEDWELHFVGSVEEGENHHQYFSSVQKEATGYQVFFHNKMSFSQLRELFSQSKIYWHATGLGEEEERNPVAFEHFGITTVEAMASGCVPVVINAGGQKEIVTANSGFCWNTPKDLITYTMQLIKNEELLEKYRNEAIQRSKYFSREKFKERFTQLLKH